MEENGNNKAGDRIHEIITECNNYIADDASELPEEFQACKECRGMKGCNTWRANPSSVYCRIKLILYT